MAGALTRNDLTEAVYWKLAFPGPNATLVEQVINEVIDTLEKGENVKIAGFGSFTIRDKATRMGRNPKTGEEVEIEPPRSVFPREFQLKDQVNRS